MLDKKMKKYVSEFLESSYHLFQERALFSTESVAWYINNDNYKFEFDSVPKIILTDVNLKCVSKGDSSIILGTSGIYHLSLDRFYGDKGKITWQRAGFDPQKTYATFNNYEIRIKSSSYDIDSVTFYNEFFEKPLVGLLKEKILANKDSSSVTYPRFESYYQRLQIQNIIKGIDYDGGFTMAGSKLIGSGTLEQPALLTFYRDSKKFLIASSVEFDIKPDRISSGHTAVVFLIDKDTISHPDLNMSFNRKSRQLVLLRADEGISKAPYSNTYHNVDMYYEALYWNMDDPQINMGALQGGTQRYAAFESNTFFKKKRYESMMGISSNHPLYERIY
jgi:hypothetical protein